MKRVGVIGTGIMGEPMARNLMKAGFSLFVHTRTRGRAAALLREGATWCESPAELAGRVEAVLSIVSDTPDVYDVYLRAGGVCSALAAGTLCIDMSTVSPNIAEAVAAEVAARGGAFLDAPVTGGKTGAHAATLTFMVGGEASAVHRADPLFRAMGRKVVHCGPVGHGQRTKLCNQILCAMNLLGVAEAMVFARKVGLDPARMLEAVSSGAAASWALDNLGPRMLARDFAPMFMIDLQQKDLRITLDEAREHATPLPGTALVSQLLASNQAHGEGRDGTQALIRTIERLADLS